jgi:hypothetical protein
MQVIRPWPSLHLPVLPQKPPNFSLKFSSQPPEKHNDTRAFSVRHATPQSTPGAYR